MAPLLALGAATCWGIADFLGGIQARRIPPLLVAFAGQLSGAVLLSVLVVISGVPAPGMGLTSLALGVGLVNAVAFFALYSALAIGNMARVAPVLGTAAMVPLIVGLASGDRPSSLQLLGSAVAICGVILLSVQRRAGAQDVVPADNRKAIGWALVAATCMGITLVGIKRVATYDPYWAVLLVRAAGIVLLGAVAALTVTRWPSAAELPWLPLVAIGGFDVAANALWAVASTLGLLSLVAVLGTLFPAVTVLLALIVLHERLESHQVAGVVAVLAGGALISAG
jgi:drug/metabolite transporter (DMT)-like permease